jgi:hypothetical protein
MINKKQIYPQGELVYPLDYHNYNALWNHDAKPKTHKIYRFTLCKIDTKIGRSKCRENSERYCQLQQELFNDCSVNFADLSNLFFIGIRENEYYCNHIIGTYNIGMDILFHEKGVIATKQWGYDYWAVPYNSGIIEKIDEKNLDFVTIKKRMP